MRTQKIDWDVPHRRLTFVGVLTYRRIYALTILFCLRQRGSADRDRRDVAFNSSGGQYSASYQNKSRTVGAVSVPNQSTVSAVQAYHSNPFSTG